MIILVYEIYQFCRMTYHHIPATHLPTILQAVLTLLPTTTDNSPSSATEIVCWFSYIFYLWNKFLLEREISTSKKQYIGLVQRISLWVDTMQFDHQQGNGFGFSTIAICFADFKASEPWRGSKSLFSTRRKYRTGVPVRAEGADWQAGRRACTHAPPPKNSPLLRKHSRKLLLFRAQKRDFVLLSVY